MSPIGPPHSSVVDRLTRLLVARSILVRWCEFGNLSRVRQI